MIFTNCSCGEPIVVGWESGMPLGFYRTDCKCGKIAMTECTSLGGDTYILDNEQELNHFVADKKLNIPPRRKHERRE